MLAIFFLNLQSIRWSIIEWHRFANHPPLPPLLRVILASKSRTCGSHLPSTTCKMGGNGSRRGEGVAWVALWQAYDQTRTYSFLMISPKLHDISPFFLLTFSFLRTADFLYYLGFQVMAILCCGSKNSLRGTGHVKWVILPWGAIPPATLQSRLLPEVPKPNTASRQISWAVGPASRNCLVTSTPSTPSHPTHPPGRRRKFLIRQPLARGFECL